MCTAAAHVAGSLSAARCEQLNAEANEDARQSRGPDPTRRRRASDGPLFPPPRPPPSTKLLVGDLTTTAGTTVKSAAAHATALELMSIPRPPPASQVDAAAPVATPQPTPETHPQTWSSLRRAARASADAQQRPPGGGPLKVVVEMPGGADFQVIWAHAHLSLAAFRALVYTATGMEPDAQVWPWQGVDEQDTLESVGVNYGLVVALKWRLRGGGSPTHTRPRRNRTAATIYNAPAEGTRKATDLRPPEHLSTIQSAPPAVPSAVEPRSPSDSLRAEFGDDHRSSTTSSGTALDHASNVSQRSSTTSCATARGSEGFVDPSRPPASESPSAERPPGVSPIAYVHPQRVRHQAAEYVPLGPPPREAKPPPRATLSVVTASLEQLGAALLDRVRHLHDERANAITARLMEMDRDEVIGLLGDEVHLAEKCSEVLALLKPGQPPAPKPEPCSPSDSLRAEFGDDQRSSTTSSGTALDHASSVSQRSSTTSCATARGSEGSTRVAPDQTRDSAPSKAPAIESAGDDSTDSDSEDPGSPSAAKRTAPHGGSTKCPVCDHGIVLYETSRFQGLIGHAKAHARARGQGLLTDGQWDALGRWLHSFKRRACPCGHVCSTTGWKKHMNLCAAAGQRPLQAPAPLPAGPATQGAPLATSEPAQGAGPFTPLQLPSLGDIFMARVSSTPNIPKALRAPLIPVLTALIRDAAHDNTERAWSLLFMFFKAVLGAPASDVASHTAAMRHKLDRWVAGDHVVLWNEAVAGAAKESKARPRKRPKSGSASRNQVAESSGAPPNMQRATDLVREGSFRKALQGLLSRGMQSATDAVLDTMAKLHPAGLHTIVHNLVSPPAPRVVTADEVLTSLTSFPAGTAAGPSSMRAEHFKGLTSADPARRLAEGLAALATVMAQGRAHESVQPHLAGANLLAIAKKDNGTRPIAVGEILRRLVGKILLARNMPKINSALGANQFGVGAKSGTERIAHLVRRLAKKHRGNRRYVLLKVDMRNAFNTVDRLAVLRAVHETCPELFPWVDWLYANESRLLFQGTVIRSSSGVQQGDPLGPALFSLALRHTVAQAGAAADFNAWYIDDGIIGGDADVIARLLPDLTTSLTAAGLYLNPSKCELVSFGGRLEPDPFPPEFKRLVDNFDIVGTPVGSDSFVADYVERKALKKLREVAALVALIPDPQIRYCIIRQCLAFGPLVQLARTVPPRQLASSARYYDSVIRAMMSNVVGVRIPDRAWEQAGLSVKAGGLGLRGVLDHLHPAFLGCAESCAFLDSWDAPGDADVSGPLADFSAIYSADGAPLALRQKDLSRLVDRRTFDQLLASSANKAERARLRAVSGEDAGAAFNALPSTTMHLALPSAHFRVITKWWLGMDLYPVAHSCPRCGATCDVKGYHALTCRHGGDLGVRHNALRNIVLHAAHDAAMGPRAEQRIVPGSNSRPADLLLPVEGELWVCDFAVTHPIQPLYVDGTADASMPVNFAAERYGADVKDARYSAGVEAHGYVFKATVVDAFGNWNTAGREVIEAVGLQSSFRDGVNARVHTRHLIQRLSVALFISNARALLVRFDPALAPAAGLPESFADAGEFDEDAPLPAAFRTSNSAAGSAMARASE